MTILAALMFLTSFPLDSRVSAKPAVDFRLNPPVKISEPDYAAAHSYDVIKYKLYMDWYDVLSEKSLTYDGIMEITFRPSLLSPLDSIRIDSNPSYLIVDSAFEGGDPLRTDSTSGKLNIVLAGPLYAGDTSTVTLYYHVTNPGISQSIPQKGFYLYYAGETDPVSGSTIPETVAYTMSEPSDARDWMPCYDNPSDKALSEISVRVPDGFVAASNGTLVGKVDNGDGSTTFNWRENYPIATYLMCVTAAKFSVIQRNYVPASGDTIPVQYYVYPQDSLKAEMGAGCNIDTVVSILKFYSSLYGPYPFDKYGMTGVQPFQYGGMEHQTITTLNRAYEFDRRDVAHELAHQWWGDMVTLGTWKDIWLNESFATYSEVMQLQHQSESQFRTEMNFYASQFFVEDSMQNRYAVYAPPAGYIFGSAEYYKGAWVLHMLRSIVGDSTFFGIMKRYRADYEYGNAVTSDFVNVVDTVTNSDMSWFFNEWIYEAGYPVYTSSFAQSGDSLQLTINQIQTNAPVFKMPMDVGIYSGRQLTVVTVWDSLSLQSFKIYYPGTADSVVLDPYDEILARYPGQNLTDVGSTTGNPGTYTLLQNYPNPFNGMTNVVYTLAAPGMVSVDLYDVLGRKVETLVHGFQESGVHRISVNAAGLASGVYICRLMTPEKQLTTKLVLEK